MARPISSLLVALVLASGCAQMGTGTTDLSDQAESVAEHTRFCLSLARTLSALDSGTDVGTALEAAEETLTRAPADLRNAGRAVTDHLGRASDGEFEALNAPAFEDAVEELRDRGLATCNPPD